MASALCDAGVCAPGEIGCHAQLCREPDPGQQATGGIDGVVRIATILRSTTHANLPSRGLWRAQDQPERWYAASPGPT